MEMRLKIVEVNAEHDFAFKGSSECIVQCLCTTFFKPVRRTPARAVIFYFFSAGALCFAFVFLTGVFVRFLLWYIYRRLIPLSP